MRETLRAALLGIARVYPYRNQLLGSYMYHRVSDMGKTGKYVRVYAILDNDRGLSMLYELNIGPKEEMNVGQWSEWLQTQVPDILQQRVLSYMATRRGGVWSVRGVVGWHFLTEPAVKVAPKHKRPQGGGRKGE